MDSVYEIRRISDFNHYVDFLALHAKDVLICAAVSDTLYNIDAKDIKRLQSIGMNDLSTGGWIGYRTGGWCG